MAVINGSSLADTLNGSAGDDTINGGAGDDLLFGAGGNDVIDGGAGTDTVRYGGLMADYTISWDHVLRRYSVVDRITGRDGTDIVTGIEFFRFANANVSTASLGFEGVTVTGSGGADTLTGGTRSDLLQGLAGNDRLDGLAGNDYLQGGDGDDTLIGGAGDDRVEGGAGANDQARFTGAITGYDISWDATTRLYTIRDRTAGRDGTDTVNGVEQFSFNGVVRTIADLLPGVGDGTLFTGTAANDTLTGGVGYDTLQGGGGDDSLAGGLSGDLLDGGAGNDFLLGGAGDDRIVGGDGSDLARYVSQTGNYDISFDWLTHQYIIADRFGQDGRDAVSGVETFIFANGFFRGDELVANTGDGVTLAGTAGNDVLWGGAGYDYLLGDAGRDVLEGRAAADWLVGGAGDDSLTGGAGDDRLEGGDGHGDVAVFSGRYADYSISWRSADRQYVITDRYYDRDGSDKVGGVELFSFADGQRNTGNLVAGMGDGDLVLGTAGDDVLTGSVGYDTLVGYEGRDTLRGDASADQLDGGEGDDWLEGSGGDDTLVGGGNEAAGAGDTASFRGLFADYDAWWQLAPYGTFSPSGQFVLVDRVAGRDGTDTLMGIETLRFADRTIAIHELVTLNGVNIFGTQDPDEIAGAGAGDYLFGAGGDDTLVGYGGNDTLVGWNGDDTVRLSGARGDYDIAWDAQLHGYTLADRVPGRDGVDLAQDVERFQFNDGVYDWSNLVAGAGDGWWLVGTAGNDALVGSVGFDTLEGGAGDDALSGGRADDVLAGGDGNDWLVGGAGNDRIDGGAGAGDAASFDGNWADFATAWDAVNRQYTITNLRPGGEGRDVLSGVEQFLFRDAFRGWSDLVTGAGDGLVVTGTSAADFLSGSNGYDMLDGGDGDDMLSGGMAQDTLRGGAGDDRLVGGGADDALDGGAGSADSASFQGARSEYDVSWDAVNRRYTVSDLAPGRDGTDAVTGVEQFLFADGMRDWGNLVAGSGDGLLLTGTAAGDSLCGSAGYDSLRGEDGNDTLEGGGADDTLVGGAGDDRLSGGAGNDSIAGGEGSGDYLRLSGARGEYEVTWDSAAGQYTVTDSLGRDGSDTVTGVEFFVFTDGTRDWSNLVAGAGEGLVLTGTPAGDWLQGSVGYDILQGLAGTDTLEGGSSADTLAGGEDDDELTGGGGDDMLDGGTGLGDVACFSGRVSEYGIHWDPAARQYVVDDNLGRDGSDRASGVEIFQFADGIRDWSNLVAGQGDGLALQGTDGNDWLVGSVGYDTLSGGESHDRLEGGLSADVLDGGAGYDTLVGGAGADSFVFSVAPGDGIDRIDDFVAGEDRILLAQAAFQGITAGPLDAALLQVGADSEARGAGVRIVFDTRTGALYHDADGAGGDDAVQFAELALPGLVGVPTAADFAGV